MQRAAMTLCRACSVGYAMTNRSGAASVRRASITAYRNPEMSTGPFTAILLVNLGSSRCRLSEGFDLVHILVSEEQVARSHDLLCLPRIAGPDDGSCDTGMTQGPGDCDFAHKTVVAVRDLSHALDQRQ